MFISSAKTWLKYPLLKYKYKKRSVNQNMELASFRFCLSKVPHSHPPFWFLFIPSLRWTCSSQEEWLPECRQGLQPKWHVQEVPLGLHQPLHQPCLHSWSLQQEEVSQGPTTVLWQGKALLIEGKNIFSRGLPKDRYFIKAESTAQRARFKRKKNEFWSREVSGVVKITMNNHAHLSCWGLFFSTPALWHWFGH